MKANKGSILRKFFAALPLCSLVPPACGEKDKKIKKNKVDPKQHDGEPVDQFDVEDIEEQEEVDEGIEDDLEDDLVPVTGLGKIIVVSESDIVIDAVEQDEEIQTDDVAIDIEDNIDDNKKNESKMLTAIKKDNKKNVISSTLEINGDIKTKIPQESENKTQPASEFASSGVEVIQVSQEINSKPITPAFIPKAKEAFGDKSEPTNKPFKMDEKLLEKYSRIMETKKSDKKKMPGHTDIDEAKKEIPSLENEQNDNKKNEKTISQDKPPPPKQNNTNETKEIKEIPTNEISKTNSKKKIDTTPGTSSNKSTPPKPDESTKTTEAVKATKSSPEPAKEAGPQLVSDMVFAEIGNTLKRKPDDARAINSLYLFVIKKNGKPAKKWVLDSKKSPVTLVSSAPDDPMEKAADCTIIADDKDFYDLASGAMNAQKAIMFGKLKVRGNFLLLQKLQSIF